jgi:DNA-binding transcriptional MerR regulator
MPIKQIKEIIELTVKGEETLPQRQQIFLEHRQDVLKRMAALQKNLEKIDCKINYYQRAYNAYKNGEDVSKISC